MAMGAEAKVKKKIKEYLATTGAWYYMPVSNGMGRVGCPDILVCYKGNFVAFEVKAPGKLKNTTANVDEEIYKNQDNVLTGKQYLLLIPLTRFFCQTDNIDKLKTILDGAGFFA